MAKLILVRHGETDWNRVNRIQGWLDIPLNGRGLCQAEELAEELLEMKISAVYSSPLRRAWQTAEAIAKKYNLTVQSHSGLKEINQGKWQGLLVTEAKQTYPELYSRWQVNPVEITPPQGENLAAVSQRAQEACQEIITACPGETACLVTHKVTAALIKCYYLGLEKKRLWELLPDNATWEVLDV